MNLINHLNLIIIIWFLINALLYFEMILIIQYFWQQSPFKRSYASIKLIFIVFLWIKTSRLFILSMMRFTAVIFLIAFSKQPFIFTIFNTRWYIYLKDHLLLFIIHRLFSRQLTIIPVIFEILTLFSYFLVQYQTMLFHIIPRKALIMIIYISYEYLLVLATKLCATTFLSFISFCSNNLELNFIFIFVCHSQWAIISFAISLIFILFPLVCQSIFVLIFHFNVIDLSIRQLFNSLVYNHF